MNSRAKGVDGELEWRDVLRAFGFEAERGQQHAGGAGSQDVRHNVPGVHFEVKLRRTFDPYEWLAQAKRDAGALLPVVACRRTNQTKPGKPRLPWLVVLDAEDFLNLMVFR